MRVVLFCHSIASDWNHGNAHFLRGVCSELLGRGHRVRIFEPADGWSRRNLLQQHGARPIEEFHRAFPMLSSETYTLDRLDLDRALEGADVVLVHEWSDPMLVRLIGRHRARARTYRLLFHDTHHRAATAPAEMARFDLREYDGVLAFGAVIRDLYLQREWSQRAWTWHEAADVRTFSARDRVRPREDLVWIGNWGDGERTSELHEYLLGPARHERVGGSIHGVRYPWQARARIRLSGLRYRGWIANHRVPDVFARHRLTVHIPRRPYVEALPGIPTIRVFEALACRVPLISAPWEDAEGLFHPGKDYLVARSGQEMRKAIRAVLSDREMASEIASHGFQTVLARHTCAHRVDELLAIDAQLRAPEAVAR